MLRNAIQLGGVFARGVCAQPSRVLSRSLHTSMNRHSSIDVPDDVLVDDYDDTKEGINTLRVQRLEKTLNKVELLGRVGGDPQKRGSEAHPVVIFSLATHLNYRKDEDLIQQTDWHRIAVFKPHLRESVYRHMSRGQRVLVHGRIGYLEQRDPNTNQIIMKIASIIADDVIYFAKGSNVDRE